MLNPELLRRGGGPSAAAAAAASGAIGGVLHFAPKAR